MTFEKCNFNSTFRSGEEVWIRASVLPRQDPGTGMYFDHVPGPNIGVTVGSGSINVAAKDICRFVEEEKQ